MKQTTLTELRNEVESLTAALSSKEVQQMFYDIVFKKNVEEGLKQADDGELTDWEDFKKEMRLWQKSK